METASKFWGEIKESAYAAMIEKLRAAQAWGLRNLRDLARDMPPLQRALAEYIIGQVEIATDILISFILAVVGLAVGLVSGLAKLVWGLLSFIHGVLTGLILFVAGFFSADYRDRFDEWAMGVKDAIANLGPALRALKDRWLADWEKANPDRKTLMIGELTGEIEAILVSIWVGGRVAPPSATVTLPAPAQVPAFAVVGGRVLVGAEGLTVTVPVAGPAVAGGLTAAMASSVDDKKTGGGGDKKTAGEPAKEPTEPRKTTEPPKPAPAEAKGGPSLKADADATRFKDHVIRHKPVLEKALGRKLANWSETHGADFIQELERLKASGDLTYVGKGTLGKGQPWAYIYRGRGLTLVQRQTGEFWTLFESGKGKDLAIQITEAAAAAPKP
jgi:hypothetical protein